MGLPRMNDAKLARVDTRRERDALRTRICILEAALAFIERETELTMTRPETSFVTMCRVAAIARQALAAPAERRSDPDIDVEPMAP